MARILDAERVLIFSLVRLSAPVPWLSGRASASHAEGRWFDPSRDHKTSSQLTGRLFALKASGKAAFQWPK